MVVADSGPLVTLARLSLLQRLPQSFATVLVPQVVFLEFTRHGDPPGAASPSGHGNALQFQYLIPRS